MENVKSDTSMRDSIADNDITPNDESSGKQIL